MKEILVMKLLKYKLVVIGGGASGMMAALSASRHLPQGEIVIIEKNSMLGKKVAASGNGRCNFSNRFCRWQDYSGKDISMVRYAFDCLNPAETAELFEKLGIVPREEKEGRLYPYSEQGTSVPEILGEELLINQVEIACDIEVKGIKKTEDIFAIEYEDGLIYAQSVIIATGGKAGHKFGSTGDGYGFAKGFGHGLRRPLPALVQVVTKDELSEEFKGIRVKAGANLIKGGEIVAREEGELQFISGGLSGICIFDLSRYLGEEPEEYTIEIDLFPEFSQMKLLNILKLRKITMKGRTAESLLKGILNSRLIGPYLNLSKIPPDLPIGQVEELKLEELARLLKGREVKVAGTKGWIEAQVTIGGINSDEVKVDSLESKLATGLFFAGEVLDVDGKCGGWNLQWAFSSGFTAGINAARYAKDMQ
jgi:predicted Rossmann fold flavoprotein